jgi:hypothetical protein
MVADDIIRLAKRAAALARRSPLGRDVRLLAV